MISDPVAKRDVWKTDLPEEHMLNRYSRQALENQRRTLDEVDPEEFDGLCKLLCDPNRRIFITGGRITGTLAQYFYLHLQMIRPMCASCQSRPRGHTSFWTFAKATC